MDNPFPVLVSGIVLGIGLGMLAANFVNDHNVAFHEAKHRKELVELGVGSYDSRTGGFLVKACPAK